MDVAYRYVEVADNMPPVLAAVVGVALLAVFAGTMWYLTRLDHTKLKDPQARARARRRSQSRKLQGRLRARRRALQRKAARRKRSG
ncbi:hypothetical protein GCM10027570_38380 [Streptomonospora sediminis]